MNWISSISITCFAASYAVSLVLEVSRLFFRASSRMFVALGFAAAGLLSHSLYLVAEAQTEIASRVIPWSNWHDFCLLAALVLAAAYWGLTIRRPGNALGIFLLPLVLALIGVALLFRDEAPFAPHAAIFTWRAIHGVTLLVGTVAVTLGFATGVMYLVQAYRLKHKLPPRQGFRLPTLEWLQRFNRETLVVSTCLLAVGLISGVVLNLSQRKEPGTGVELTDPVVLSSGVLFAWLLAITLFEWWYRPARQGSKVAYLTLASFVFLCLALFFVLFGQHATQANPSATPNSSTEVE